MKGPFIFKVPTGFNNPQFDKSLDSIGGPRDAKQVDTDRWVRRPLRGIQIKKETFATIHVFRANQQRVGIHNSSANLSGKEKNFTSNFLLQAVSEVRAEKFQPITTFSSTYGFFFGEQPRMLTFQAVLMNTADFQWEVEWWANYDEYLRGTKLTERGARAYVSYDDKVVEGYVNHAMTIINATQPQEVQLTFTMWVTAYNTLVTPGDSAFPPSDSVLSTDDQIRVESIDGNLVSTTAEVRRLNEQQILLAADADRNQQGSPIGLFNKLRRSLSSLQNTTDSTLIGARNFLFGRNLVVPKGFAGSARQSGDPQFIPRINIRTPGRVRGPLQARTFVYDNFDEYPKGGGNKKNKTREELALIDSAYQRHFGLSGLSLAGFRDASSSEFEKKAIETFRSEFGIDVEDEDGGQTSDAMRVLGKVTYGVVSFGAAHLAASQKKRQQESQAGQQRQFESQVTASSSSRAPSGILEAQVVEANLIDPTSLATPSSGS